jgi:hypothetical protein
VNFERRHLLFQSDDEFDAFVRFERERRAHSSMRPAGARLSTVCPVRLVQAVHDDRAEQPIDPGDAERGHEMESRIRATMLHGEPHEYQPRVDWSHGVSAFDVRETDGTLWDFKSSAGRIEYKPVTLRRMVAAGMDVGSVVRILVVHPGNYTWNGPYDVELDEPTRDHYAIELRKIGTALDQLKAEKHPERGSDWRVRAWWATTFGLVCSCGGCTDHTELEANNAVERMGFRMELAMDRAEEAGRMIGGKVQWKWLDVGVRADLIAALDRQAEARKPDAIANGSSIVIETYGTSRGLRCSWSPKSATWTVKHKKESAPAEAAA